MTGALLGGLALAGAILLPAQDRAPASGVSRWVDVQTGTLSARHRSVANSADVWTTKQLQYAGQLRARLKADAAARLTLNVLYATGSNFTGSWNNTGIGTGDFAGTWALKHLYVAWAPVAGVELGYGSMGAVRGAGTEITTYDNDAYIAGERVTVRRPKDVFFTEITATRGYIGDLQEPSVFDRFDRLTGGRNYYQLLASKTAGAVTVSGDYSRLSGVPWVRLAASLKTPALVAIDTVRVETYARFGDDDARGFAVSGEKAIGSRVTAGAGYADVDPRYPAINADRFMRGKRLYVSGSARLTRELSAQLFATAAVNNRFAIPAAKRVDAVLVYNLLGRLQRAGWLD
jgi:hypothetical protein